MIHNLLLLGVIFLLLHLANLTEVLSYLSRPLVTGAAAVFGIEAVNRAPTSFWVIWYCLGLRTAPASIP